jgi:MoaA/NifB/PqqE/SkfB family radical SAM enzyme
VKKFKDSGVHDFLISFHGIGDENEIIFNSNNKGVTKRQLKALDNLSKNDISFRFNVTLLTINKHQLTDIAKIMNDYGGLVINYISFNPYFEWTNKNDIFFQPLHSDLVPHLIKAINFCNEKDIEVNVRYFPICLLKGYEKHIYTNFQLPFDQHEWDFNSWHDRQMFGLQDSEWYYNNSISQSKSLGYIQGNYCKECAIRSICDGFHVQYANRWGFSEAIPYTGNLIDDPTHFIKHQKKITYSYQEAELKFSKKINLPLSKLNLSQFLNNNRAGIATD